MALSLEPVSLAEVMIEPQALKRGIIMTFPKAEAACFVRADRTRLKQVLVNLLSNAIKYNQTDGPVLISCAPGTAGIIRISVQDSGAGLSPEKVAQLFQPFNRLGQETGGEEGTASAWSSASDSWNSCKAS